VKRSLGRSGLEIEPLMLGGNVFGWTADPAMSFRILDAFVDAGFSAIDTADVYSAWVPGHTGGESETVIGNWLKKSGKRSRVMLATKIGHGFDPGPKGLSKKWILEGVEQSLKRLQTDHIDLYQSHVDDANTPFAERFEAYSHLIRQGKVRAIGASNYSGERLSEAIKVSREMGLPSYQTLQPLYNLYDRAEFESKLAPVCEKEGLAVIPYYTLASGFLTGKYRVPADRSKSPRGDRAERYSNDRGFRILAAMDEVSRAEKASLASIAVAWLRDRPTVAAPIASATKPEHLDDLISGARLRLSEASLATLERASAY
jgi:aryl-alcohol dehydrogenase-like predicted oxidoreductase